MERKIIFPDVSTNHSFLWNAKIKWLVFLPIVLMFLPTIRSYGTQKSSGSFFYQLFLWNKNQYFIFYPAIVLMERKSGDTFLLPPIVPTEQKINVSFLYPSNVPTEQEYYLSENLFINALIQILLLTLRTQNLMQHIIIHHFNISNMAEQLFINV
jgi:hypothetical protein